MRMYRKFLALILAAFLLFLTACVRTPSVVTATADCPGNPQSPSTQLKILDNSDKE
jgi:uncharacterized lipoprotein YajG